MTTKPTRFSKSLKTLYRLKLPSSSKQIEEAFGFLARPFSPGARDDALPPAADGGRADRIHAILDSFDLVGRSKSSSVPRITASFWRIPSPVEPAPKAFKKGVSKESPTI